MIRVRSSWLLGLTVIGWAQVSVAEAQLSFDPTLILGPPPELPAAPPPVVDRLPDRTPYPTLPIRGHMPPSEEGQISAHVLVLGLSKPVVVRTALGKFCGEVAFDAPGTYELELRNQDIHGTVSEATRYVVTYDPKAPVVPWLRSCAGTEDLGQCKPSPELCDNGQDDDCDGLADRSDPDCDRQCSDDVLELRDGSVPYLSYGTTRQLRLCEGQPTEDVDRFGVHVRAGHGLLLGVKAVNASLKEPVELRISAAGRSAVVVSNDPTNALVSLGFFPSQIDSVNEARNIEFAVFEVNGRAVEYQVFAQIVRIDPANDLAAQEAAASQSSGGTSSDK